MRTSSDAASRLNGVVILGSLMEAARTRLLVDKLNSRWYYGRPAASLAAAGVLVHMLDGPQGIDFFGFVSGHDGLPRSAAKLWEGATAPRDVLPGSLVGRFYPFVYSPVNVPHLVRAGLGHLPGLILDPSQIRARCCYPFDFGTNKLRCPAGASDCIPGCSPDAEYTRREVATSHFAGAMSDARPYAPYELAQCVRVQVQSLAGKRLTYSNMRLSYNELVLAPASNGSSLAPTVRALFVPSEGSPHTLALARQVRAAAEARGVRMPLLWYDRRNDTPFSLVQMRSDEREF